MRESLRGDGCWTGRVEEIWTERGRRWQAGKAGRTRRQATLSRCTVQVYGAGVARLGMGEGRSTLGSERARGTGDAAQRSSNCRYPLRRTEGRQQAKMASLDHTWGRRSCGRWGKEPHTAAAPAGTGGGRGLALVRREPSGCTLLAAMTAFWYQW